MPSQSARILVLLCAVMGLMGSSGLAPGYAAEDREILNQATQPWDTGSTHKRVISVRPGHRVYESRVD